MSARARSTASNNTNGSAARLTKSSARKDNGTAADDTSNEERVEHERAALVRSRQAELETVVDAHDTLIRENFHLDKFVWLLSYDPQVAKNDNSAVFKAYKERFDLVQQSVASGSSRRTRRAHTERLQSLKTPSAPSPASRASLKGRKSDLTESPATPVENITRQPKGKGKAPAAAFDSLATPSIHRSAKSKGKMKAVDMDEEVDAQRLSHYVQKRASDGIAVLDAQPPIKKRRLAPAASLPNALIPPLDPRGEPSENIPTQSISAGIPQRAAGRKRDSHRHEGALSVPTRDMGRQPPSVTKSPLKRVKLIVRPPDPVYSSPTQRPRPPKHGGSLGTFLSSFTVLDGNDVDEATIEQRVQRNMALWERVDSLKRRGRFFPTSMGLGEDTHSVFGTATSNVSVACASQDPWANVVEAVKARTLYRPVNGRQIAGQVASRIRAYWESRAVKEDKVKMLEEKRLRTLAKATIKMVIAEWKKAVHHVREEERLKREEEERRRGHEHLDAILDQSGQILEAQQLDLTKAVSRSRSSSVSATLRHWASPSPGLDEESSTETERGASDEESDEASASDDDVGGMDSTFLLGHDDRSLITRRTSSSRSVDERSVSAYRSPEDPDVMDREVEGLLSAGHEHSDTAHPSVTSASPLADTAESASNMDVETPKTPADELDQYDQPTTLSFDADIPIPSKFNADLDASNHGPAGVDVKVSLTPSVALDSSDMKTDFESHPDADVMLTNGSDQFVTSMSQVESPEELDEQIVKDTHSSARTRSPSADPDDDSHMRGSTEPDMVTEHTAKITNGAVSREETADSDDEGNTSIPHYLQSYAVAPVEWDPQSKVKAPLLLRGSLRPYQQGGLEWLASLHTNNLNGILADEMGLGKTIQTISLLAHLACDRGIWGPHLIIVPTSVLLNWEMEFKKFLPGFKVLSYHGNTKRRKELRQGWNNKYHFNVCVTSYTLASRDAHVFKRKPWYYMILDEAHMIKNFKSQRWNILLMFRSFRRLLLTGTPLQNNLTELWALLQFLMSGTNFANLKEFGEWFSNPLEKAIEMGTMDDETQQRVSKLHMVLRPYLLRRLKRDVEKELPQKYEHLVMCPLSKRQRFLYDEFMARAETRHDLHSGVYQKIANILMQLRKVVNHPDLFEIRPIVTSFAMERSAIADFEIKELLIRRQLLHASDEDRLNLDVLGLQFVQVQNTSLICAVETRRLDGTSRLPMTTDLPGEPPPCDMRTVAGYKQYRAWQLQAKKIAKWAHVGYLNKLRCASTPSYSAELITIVRNLHAPLHPLAHISRQPWSTPSLVQSGIKTYADRAEDIADVIDKFAFATPAVVARDLPYITLSGFESAVLEMQTKANFDSVLHRASVKLQIAFPDPSLLQYDCGKLQELARLLRERKAGGHRVLIFTQMTKILDILEVFLNFHGYLYLRLDGATKIEDRQYITERFNSDPRVFCFISSSRSGGVGINLTGADTVIFYDSDFNPQMDRQCEDRAHRIGQIRDVHIYRFVSEHTVEEALLRKANQKRSLDDIVIQRGEFDWRSLFSDETALTKALGEFEDTEDAYAAAVAAREEVALVGADEADFTWEGGPEGASINPAAVELEQTQPAIDDLTTQADAIVPEDEEEEEAEEGGTTVDYMLAVVRSDMDYFGDWRL